MKLKFTFASLVGLLASGLVALAQTAAPADNGQPAPAVVAPTPQDTSTNAATATPDAGTAAATATNSAVTPDTSAGSTMMAGTNAAATRDPNAVMPLISMEDVPLTDAIKNLARQASLNYMLDPHIPFLAAGPDGRSQQPNVSLRLENVTAEQALTALLNNYSLQIVDDPKTKISRITVKDPAAPDPLVTKAIQLKYADPTNFITSVQTVLIDKRSRVVADVRTSQLVIVATDKELAAVDELVNRLDKPTPQVLIEAKLVETDKSPTSTKGIDWSGTLQNQQFSFGNNVAGGTRQPPASVSQTTLNQIVGSGTNAVSVPASIITTITQGPNNLLSQPGLLVDTARGFNPATAFLDADGVSAALSFLNTSANAKILSTPRAVTLDNQAAVLSVTTAEPIFMTTAGTQGSPGGSQVSYTNLGTILTVTPRISANAMINLHVVPEVSDLAGTITKTVSGEINQADFFDIRRIDTRVTIPSGNTLVMGGLVSDDSTDNNTKVPIMGDIPGLGWLFRQESKTQVKKNLIIFLTPTIVQDEDFQPTVTEFLKTKPNDKPTADFGAWDSGEPQDWSKLIHNSKVDDDQ
jgi:type II secretory pathway component GspD/PulD (secretin)